MTEESRPTPSSSPKHHRSAYNISTIDEKFLLYRNAQIPKNSTCKMLKLAVSTFFLGGRYYVRSTYVTSISAKHSSISALDATSL